MISITVYEDIFNPTRRTQRQVAHREGALVSEYAPPGGALVAWINGALVVNEDRPLRDGDFVHYAVTPEGPLIAALPYLVVGFFVSIIAGGIMKALMPREDPVEDRLGGSHYSYYGFRNAYRPEGDAIPVVYGTMRVSPPCINQSVTGQHLFNSTVGLAVPIISRTERLNSMYAVSHGPIAGFGTYEGDVYDGDSFDVVVPLTGGDVRGNIGFQVNGIDGRHINARIEWRTGLLTQQPIVGLLGSAGLPVTDPGTAYSLAFEILVGTADISEADKSSGVYLYGDRIFESQGAQFVSLLLTAEADICDVQILFAKGLFQGASDGNPDPATATIRIQYWKTDATGVTTGDVYLLPAYEITNASASPFSVDLLFSLYDPTTVTPAANQGWCLLDAQGDDTLFNTTASGMALLRPGSSGADDNLQFTFACFASMNSITESHNLWLWSSSNASSKISAMDIGNTGFYHLDGTKDSLGWADGDEFFGICLRVVKNSAVPVGAQGDIFLCVYAYENRSASRNAGSWWRSSQPVGTTSVSGGGWPGAYPANPPKEHICLTYDGTNWTPTGGSGQFRLYLNGNEVSMQLGEPGSVFAGSSALFSYDGQAPGFLWDSGTPQGGNVPNGYDHVPPLFRAPASGGGIHIGSLMSRNGSGLGDESRGQVSQVLMYDGLVGGSDAAVSAWATQAATFADLAGHLTYDIRTMADDPAYSPHLRVCCPMDSADVVATNFYKNFAYPAAVTAAAGALQIEDIVTSVKAGDGTGPVWFSESGTPSKGYYRIEVFRESPTTNENNARDIATIDSITTWRTQAFNYPGVAYLATSISATDQVNSNTPNITVICKGKKVKIWDGGSETSPIFSEEWSNNPAWVSLDMITNSLYGMGSIFLVDDSYGSIDLPAFAEWAAFCDEGVPDAFGVLDFFGLQTGFETASGETVHTVTLLFGLLDTSGAVQQTIPKSWRPDRFQSITAVIPNTIHGNWKTSEDYVAGTNMASNRLEVLSIDYLDDPAGFHGWSSYLSVTLAWNRLDSSGQPIWPAGTTSGDAFYADLYDGETTLGSAGQYEKRCTFDGVFDGKNRAAWDALIDVFQSGRAMPVKAGRKILPVWDRPRDPVGLFTMANIVEGSLSLDYLSPEMNPNSIETEILDAEHGFERRTIVVDHDSVQNPENPTGFGQTRKERSRRIGTTRRSQAIRDSYYRLNRYHLQRRRASFSVGPDALHLLPGDRVLLSHDVPQYGYSGRLTSNAAIANSHPGSGGLAASWAQNGGSCMASSRSLIIEDSATAPIVAVGRTASPSALGYALPTESDGRRWQAAGKAAASGYNSTPTWASQHISSADGLYPFPGNKGTPLGALDKIAHQAQKKEFSCYIKEPATGASESFRINLYRYVDDDGYVKNTRAVRFDWNASGNLTFGAYESDSGSSPYGLSYIISSAGVGWWRATVLYDNDAATGAGAAGVGSYIQARLYYAYAPTNATWFASPTGRGSNLLQFGDPTNLGGLKTGTTGTAWTKISEAVGSNDISHPSASAPPFYPGDTGVLLGQRGFVVRIKNSEVAGGSNPAIQQEVTLATDWPGSGGAGDMAGEKICCTFFVRIASDNAASDAAVLLRMATTSSTSSGAYPGWYDGNWAGWTITPTGAGSIVYAENESGAVQTEVLSQIAVVRQNSTTNDADWYQCDCVFSSDTDFATLFFQVGVTGNTGGAASIDLWGFRVHGEGGTGSTGEYVNQNTHRGTIMWGAMYDSEGDGTESAYAGGATLYLDRDVTLSSGNSYEVYLRSSFSVDPLTGSDVHERVFVDPSEVPVSGSIVKAARDALSVSVPEGMTPAAGDVYSFGVLNQSVEDLVVTDIAVNSETLIREISAIEYVEAIYIDTDFGTMGDLTVSDLLPPTAGGSAALYGFGGDGPAGSAFGMVLTSMPYRDAGGQGRAAIQISVTPPRGTMPYRELRLWISHLASDGSEGQARLIATLPFAVQVYRYDDPALKTSTVYRIRAQRVGWRGTSASLATCPSRDITPTISPPIPTAPSLEVGVDGFAQTYRVTANQDSRVSSVEARIGGWVISTPAFLVDPDAGHFASANISLGATNAKGQTNFPVVARARLASGKYGQGVRVTSTASFVDPRSTSEKVGEDAWASYMTVPPDLEVTAGGELQWDTTVPSTALGPQYVKMNEFDLGAATRAIPVALIEGYQLRPETLADLAFTLDSDDGRRWSIEGPMDDAGTTAINASVGIEWRWTSAATLTTEEYEPFEGREVYFRKCQFRLVWRRPAATFQVKLTRFTAKIYMPPLYDPSDVDGGTF